MTKHNYAKALLIAGIIAVSPTAVSAQSNATAANYSAMTATINSDSDMLGTSTAPMDAPGNDLALAQTVQPEREDDNDFPWGLLGLLGLAGLLGRKRKDDDHVRVDRTRDTPNLRT